MSTVFLGFVVPRLILEPKMDWFQAVLTIRFACADMEIGFG